MKRALVVLPFCILILTGWNFAQQGYVVVGETRSYTHEVSGYDFLVYKLDAGGNKQWRKNFGGMEEDAGYSIQQTADGGYVVTGYTDSYTNGGYDFLIYKLDTGGKKQWRKNLGGSSTEYPYSIRQTSDGGYAVAGYTGSYPHGITTGDFLIYKLDADGGKRWRRNYGGLNRDYAYSMELTADGGYVMAGITDSYTHVTDYWDILIYKLDADGNKQWRKNLGGAGYDYGHSCQQTSDGGYVVAGHTDSYTNGGHDFLVYKLDAGGNKQWRRNYGGIENDRAYSIRQTADGGYVVAGYTYSYTHGSGDRDVLIYKLDAGGNKLWRKNLGGTENDVCESIRQTADGGYILAGNSKSYAYDSGDRDFLIYKLDADGNKQWRKNLGGADEEYAYCIRQTVN
jgi:uncharacterized delta-60 repeat protein